VLGNFKHDSRRLTPKTRRKCSHHLTTNIMVFPHQKATSPPNFPPITLSKLRLARTDGYGACYNGCNDCSDINWSYNRCQLTAQAIVPGVNCSGWLMWNWLDRYPTVCLQALGEIYKAEALDLTIKIKPLASHASISLASTQIHKFTAARELPNSLVREKVLWKTIHIQTP
jgi:hypothetical protein